MGNTLMLEWSSLTDLSLLIFSINKLLFIGSPHREMHIGVGFQHTILAQIWPNVWIFGVLWCDGWACFLEMHASRWEVLDLVIREVWNLNLPKLRHNQLAMNCLFNLSFNHLCESL